ncbi:putative mitochondrial chaperone BCS1-A-like isoform 2 [Capsicum annuum]|nr:putative mitochondrial chaperone BCS1-A-like isoform 2 [Capsicum annuum]KAF3678449.1 putative mitochondrial chaperone BCS1-A-like isoform 2 [Capsicum annuum]
MDMKTAFLNGELEEEIYIEQPKDFVVPGKENKVLDKFKHMEFGIAKTPMDVSFALRKNKGQYRAKKDTKSIIVIEDRDCSLDLTGQRGKNTKKKDEEDKEKSEEDAIKEKMKKGLEVKEKQSEVTLSGLLNFIDGLWSGIGGERLIVFTTNYVEKLDPALIRRGRMDKHIGLSYCCFESFKVLAHNCLDAVESHVYFPEIHGLLEETNMTPADIAENLMPKSSKKNADICLERLIKALETAKEEAKLKAEEEERANAAEKEKKRKIKRKGIN